MLVKNRERLWLVLNREQPDRVPTFCQSIEAGFVRRFDEEVGVESDHGFPLARFDLALAKELGLDSKWVHAGRYQYPPDPPEAPLPAGAGEGARVTAQGHVQARNPRTGEWWYVDGALKTPELVRAWTSYVKEVIPSEEEYYRAFARDVWEHGCEKADFVPIPTAGGPIYTTWASIGVDRLAWMARKHPPLLGDLFRAWGRVTKEEHSCFFEQGVDAVFVCDDHAFKDRLLFSPAQYERFVVPVYEDLAKNAHKHGAKFLVHTDGFLEEAIPLMVRAGVDAVEPLEYEAGNRLGRIKERHGGEIALIGNVAATWVLCNGSVEDAKEATKQALDDAMAGGGYVCAPGSDVLSCTKVENLRAMVATVNERGWY
ncbi:MAG: hypothetical protein Kow0069_26360 [Promethearchaeota archaeon]